MARCVMRSDDGNGECPHQARPGSILCTRHGADLPQMRRDAAERIALARLTSLNLLVLGVEEAMATYLEIMRHGDKDSTRLRAADRVMELAGVPLGKPILEVNVNVGGLKPEEDPRDARLLSIIERIDSERAALLRTRAIEVAAREETA